MKIAFVEPKPPINVYFFLKLLKNKKRWWLFGISFGLVILMKYTGVFLIPIYITYILFTQKNLLKDWRLYTAFLLSLLIFSPVIIYNFYLHPWEFEPDQPRMNNIKLNYKIRHYTGLKHTKEKFIKLIRYMRDLNTRFLTLDAYLCSILDEGISNITIAKK